MANFGMHSPSPADTPPKPKPKGIRLADLAGMDEARQWGEGVARDIALYKTGKLDWTDIDPGCLLYGPPGTGKTTYAKALAATCDIPLIATSYSEWQSSAEGHLASTMAAMKADFARAVQSAPCLLFIDELDSIPKRGTGQHAAYFNAVVNALLKEFDLLSDANGVIVVGACNHPELLDAALVRSGRMDRMIGIPLPSVDDLETIIAFHLNYEEQLEFRGFHRGPTRLSQIALLCAGMSGADVAKAVRGARQCARNNKRVLSVADFFEVLDPPAKRPDIATRSRIAAHESGHVVAGLRLAVSSKITASIIATEGSFGRIALRRANRVLTQEEIENLLVVLLAGRAAEEIGFGSPSDLSGGNSETSDLAQATRLAGDAVAKFGYSRNSRLLWLAPNSHTNPLLTSGPLSDEVKFMLDAAYQRAKSLIAREPHLMGAIYSALSQRRVLSHAEIMALASDVDGAGSFGGVAPAPQKQPELPPGPPPRQSLHAPPQAPPAPPRGRTGYRDVTPDEPRSARSTAIPQRGARRT